MFKEEDSLKRLARESGKARTRKARKTVTQVTLRRRGDWRIQSPLFTKTGQFQDVLRGEGRLFLADDE